MTQKISKRLDEITSHLINIAQEARQSTLVNRLNDIKSVQSSNYPAIALIGEVGCGKSSIINALLRQNILPVDKSSITKYYVALADTPEISATVHYRNGSTKAIDPTTSALQIETQNATPSTEIEYIEIGAKTDFLPPNAHLLWSPGLGRINPAHKEITAAVLAQSDTLLFVIKATASLSKEEQNLLQSLPSHITQLVIVITKVDAIEAEQRQAVCADLTNRVQKLRPTSQIKFVNVSAKAVQDTHGFGKVSTNSFAADWTAFVNLIQTLQPQLINKDADMEASRYAKELERLRVLATDLEKSLQTETLAVTTALLEPTDPRTAQRVADLRKTQHLLLQVVTDRSADILQMTKDSLGTTVFQLEKSQTPNEAITTLQQWSRDEETRMTTRLQRLFKTVLDDISRATHQTYDDLIPIVESIKFQIAPPATQAAGISKKSVRLGIAGLGGVAAGATFYALNFPFGLLVPSGVVAFTIWLLSETSDQKIPRHSLSEIGKTILPLFEQNIQNNGDRLRTIINEAFQQASQATSDASNSSVDEAKTMVRQNLLADLKNIQQSLEALANV